MSEYDNLKTVLIHISQLIDPILYTPVFKKSNGLAPDSFLISELEIYNCGTFHLKNFLSQISIFETSTISVVLKKKTFFRGLNEHFS